jgi:hypothetical protein
VTGHVSGVPVEELVPALMGGGSAWLVLRLAAFRLRRGRPGR